MKQEELPWHIFLRTWNTRWQFLQLYTHISDKTGRKHLTFLFNLWPQCNNFQRISSESLISLPQLLFKEKRPRKQLPVTLVGPEMNISLWYSTFCFHNTSSCLCLVYFENATLLFFFIFFLLFSVSFVNAVLLQSQDSLQTFGPNGRQLFVHVEAEL